MMFLWLPFVFLIAWLVWRAGSPADARLACCGTSHAGPPAQSGAPKDAIEIARERLARGEITIEEYETIRRALG